LINAQLQLQGKLQKGLHMTGSRWVGNWVNANFKLSTVSMMFGDCVWNIVGDPNRCQASMMKPTEKKS
jgi:hypothetical protein